MNPSEHCWLQLLLSYQVAHTTKKYVHYVWIKPQALSTRLWCSNHWAMITHIFVSCQLQVDLAEDWHMHYIANSIQNCHAHAPVSILSHAGMKWTNDCQPYCCPSLPTFSGHAPFLIIYLFTYTAALIWDDSRRRKHYIASVKDGKLKKIIEPSVIGKQNCT